ncbi:metal ABC transporter substrate-binding protein [Frigoriglobus tundricola]|uniref:Zinc ABC transporter, periplasmic-binding protein ZnuA n=1 Tax=Frigoriglobus tundricola TaxID=2774151 RepID=A0A6M5Z208_9BACT|nr:zinc ABC transporter substrate-binding protein [Frigoriglobus tundricola]QJW99814.1 Zinc ABC transporter, periplasmic-binding protein ZnuA [Frigoriglobus tundricola]
MSRGHIWLKAAGVMGVGVLLALVMLGCGGSKTTGEWPEKPGPKIVVSFAPLYCLAANVAGDDATVKNVMTTTGPHDFNPTADEVKLLSKADFFFIIGLGLDEDTAKKMKDGANNSNLKVVELGEKLPADKLCEGKCEHDHGHDGKHDHGKDPHIWLSPDHAILMVNVIRDELKAADPAHAAGYDARAADYIKKLAALKEDGLAQLKGKENKRLVSFHDSLAYFEQAYDLKVMGVLTQKPGEEPDEKQMKKLIRLCADEQHPIRVIAVEPQYSTSTSGATLKKELINRGVKDPVLVEIDPLETVRPDELTPDWYEKKMRANVKALADAMK